MAVTYAATRYRRWLLLFGGICILGFSHCELSDARLQVPKDVTTHCGSCHLVPQPSSLTKDIWQHSVLPKMSEYFKWSERSLQFPYANRAFYNAKGQLPMTDQTWALVVDYYRSGGLDSVVIRPPGELPKQTLFTERPLQLNDLQPGVTALFHSPEAGLVVAHHGQLTFMDSIFHPRHSIPTGTDVTHIIKSASPDTLLILGAGPIDPHEGAYGGLFECGIDSDTMGQVIRSLRRPVYLFKQDQSLYISEFGFLTGQLSNYTGLNDSIPKIIHSLPGSYKIHRARLHHDRPAELIVLVAQGMEGIYRITDDNNVEAIMRFPPEFGVSDLDICDIDGDGLDDLLVTNGDNADYSMMPKAYHGIRIFHNNGDGTFEQIFYYPLYGATQARFIDADGMNQPDIIASCFFNENQTESLILLTHEASPENYIPFHFDNAATGKWMVLSVDDINMDGYDDVLIGSYLGGPMARFQSEDTFQTDVLILLNKRGLN